MFLTVAATVAVQISGRRATSRDTKHAFDEQRKQLDTTLAAQREQLDRTLAEQRTRTLNERFATAAGQLGDDKPPAVRLAGVYAMAGLADDWKENRQTCIDVLCAYLRLPHYPDTDDDVSTALYWANREVRHTVIRVIAAHLRDGAAVSWQGLNFDFTGVVFDGGDFSGARFSSGIVLFTGAEFSGGWVVFSGVRFSGGLVSFFSTRFSGGNVLFDHAEFSGSDVSFTSAGFSAARVSFWDARFSAGDVDFRHARFSGDTIDFGNAVFSGGTVDFTGAEFSGSEVDFSDAVFSGSEVDFSDVRDWSFPPKFPWTDTPPTGVKLPKKEDQSPT